VKEQVVAKEQLLTEKERQLEEQRTVFKELCTDVNKESHSKENQMKQLKEENSELERKLQEAEQLAQEKDITLKDETKLYSQQVNMMKERLKQAQDEMTKKDTLLLEKLNQYAKGAKKGTPDSEWFDRLATELEKSKEKSTALAEHNSFLCSEIERLENEREVRAQAIGRLNKQLSQLRVNGGKGQLPNESLEEMRKDLEWVKNRYFVNLAMSVKLQGQYLGWFSNTDVNLLYEMALNEDIPIQNWPDWITTQIQKKSVPQPM